MSRNKIYTEQKYIQNKNKSYKQNKNRIFMQHENEKYE